MCEVRTQMQVTEKSKFVVQHHLQEESTSLIHSLQSHTAKKCSDGHGTADVCVYHCPCLICFHEEEGKEGQDTNPIERGLRHLAAT